MKGHRFPLLPRLGLHGYGHLEPVILAALVSGDPLLLIGKAGTGKTMLLNGLAKALGLRHRHYNASFLSFDDLLGFPWPDPETRTVHFLPTPATVWDAESVLIDEISRCRPEVQNKLFSLVHERVVQGIPLPELRYRWAAMNPVFQGGGEEDRYEGSISLDQALGDRFAWVLEVPDWHELSEEEQRLILQGESATDTAACGEALQRMLRTLQPRFEAMLAEPPAQTAEYVRIAASLLGQGGHRVSPRRVRLILRNLLSLQLVQEYLQQGGEVRDWYRQGLGWSLPQRAWKAAVPQHAIDAAHIDAWELANPDNDGRRWLSELRLREDLVHKASMLLDHRVEASVRSLGLMQFLQESTPDQRTIFVMALQPLLADRAFLDEEAAAQLNREASAIWSIDAELQWRRMIGTSQSIHPTLAICDAFIDTLPKSPKRRRLWARHLFLSLLNQQQEINSPEFLEQELERLFTFARKQALQPA
jgi:MoxR-like ATPase